MARRDRLGAGPPGKGTGERQAASPSHKPSFIGQAVGGVFERNPADESGEGKAEDFLADLPFVRPIE